VTCGEGQCDLANTQTFGAQMCGTEMGDDAMCVCVCLCVRERERQRERERDSLCGFPSVLLLFNEAVNC